ncbi:golgi complex component [Trichophyton tonsurans CBS 112818]|uniref:Golgi complex component n=1 Tax=Trichophyton tonsurans (strain CBS 112818) TaxID=647933 RepID=F2S9X0_TRIT1|nr:golgi complex component [Trichophyton tonsurans CBS 112818]
MGPTIEGSDNEPQDDELDLRDPGSDVDVGANADIDEQDESELVGTGEDEDTTAPEGGDSQAHDDDLGSVSSGRDMSAAEAGASGLVSDGGEGRSRQRSREQIHDSVEDLGSIPDDTPSVQDSLVSSPGSSAFAHRGSSSNLSPVPHRPFDRRFQSRLSVSSIPPSNRSVSPALSLAHSRNSSLASHLRFDSSTPELPEEDSEPAPWEVVRWTKLKKIAGQVFSEVGKRNFGRPTCTAVSTSIVLGTTKGVILVFDYQQNLKSIIGPGTKAVSSGSITALAISADHSTLAGGHADGTIFTWEIARPARPFLHIPPIPRDQLDSRRADGHVTGVSVIHIGFLGTRHTALVSADDNGMAFSHLATRGMGAVGRVVRTTRILGRYPELSPSAVVRKPSSVLAFSPLPLGNVDQPTDSLGLVAMLTPYLLVIVSTTPVARTQYKSGRPKELAAHSALTATLAWFPAIKIKGKDSEVSKTKLVYCWSNVLTILDVDENKQADDSDKDRPVSIRFKPRCRWRADEAIVAVQWISRSVLAVMTITQQLLILEDTSLRVTDSSDLIHKHIYHVDLFSRQLHTLIEQLNDDDDENNEQDQSMHGVIADAFYMSFRAYKGRLFLLGFNDICVGSLSNWADRLLALVESGDFIGAIRLATSFYTGRSEKLTVGLPEEDELRHQVVQEKLLEMMSASLRFAFGKNAESDIERLQKSQLSDLADACIFACEAMDNHEFLFEDVYSWYEEYEAYGVFMDALEPYIIKGSVRALPPTAVKSLISHFVTTHTASRLEEIICLLETDTMDIDQVTSLCKKHNFYDAFIYVWNRALHDYVSPLQELLNLVRKHKTQESGTDNDPEVIAKDHANASRMFPYLSYILTSRVYPTGDELEEHEALSAKNEIYKLLFSGKSACGDRHSNDLSPFQSLRMMLEFDTPSFMSMLNEAFEDSFLNDPVDQWNKGEHAKSADGSSINRQYLLRILLEVMDSNSSDFGPTDTIYLDMFIARNLPKYPQYILLSGSTLQQVLVRLCQYPSIEMLDDCQLSAEYLLSTYHPPDIQALVPLFKEAKFFRILKSTYRTEKRYSDLLRTYIADPEDQQHVFVCIRDYLRPSSSLNKKQRRDILATMEEIAKDLASINIYETAHTVQSLAPELHEKFLQALQNDSASQYEYLHTIIEDEQKPKTDTRSADTVNHELVEKYLQLMCQYNPSHVADFINLTKVGDLQLEAVIPYIENSGIVDAAVILLAKQGEVTNAMERLTRHLSTLEAGLCGLLQNADDTPDSANAAEAVTDLILSVEKYTQVGTWLCKEQSKAARRVHEGGKFNKRGSSVFEQPLTYDENLWLVLIEAVVKIAQQISPLLKRGLLKDNCKGEREVWQVEADEDDEDANQPGHLSSSFRSLVQQVFTSLLTSTTKARHAPHQKTDVSFLRILRAFLTRAAAASPSLSELRTVIGSIFSAYTYEESLLSLANTMLDKDLFVHVNEITKLRQKGWRPRGQVCEVCRRRVWGPGTGAYIWDAWENEWDQQHRRRRNQFPDSDRDYERDINVSSRNKGKGIAVPSAPTSSLTQNEPSSRRGKMAAVPADDSGTSVDGGGSSQATGAASAGTTPAAPVDLGPLIVFGCRHLYHQSCLTEAVAQQYGGDNTSPSIPAEPTFHRHIHDRIEHRQFSCLLCK